MRRWALRVLAAVSALVAVLLAVAVNAAATSLPRFLNHHPGRAWALVAVLGVASIGCAVLSVRANELGARGSVPSGVQGGVHAGRDLTIKGHDNVVAGGDYVSPPTPSPPPPPGSTRPWKRRDRH